MTTVAAAGRSRTQLLARILSIRVSLRDTPAERTAALEEFERLRNEAAIDFGMCRGWRLTDRPFSPAALARRGMHRGYQLSDSWPALADHPYHYRWPENHHAAGVACHVYDGVPDALAWAKVVGLKATVLGGSWYLPGTTILVLFEPNTS